MVNHVASAVAKLLGRKISELDKKRNKKLDAAAALALVPDRSVLELKLPSADVVTALQATIPDQVADGTTLEACCNSPDRDVVAQQLPLSPEKEQTLLLLLLQDPYGRLLLSAPPALLAQAWAKSSHRTDSSRSRSDSGATAKAADAPGSSTISPEMLLLTTTQNNQAAQLKALGEQQAAAATQMAGLQDMMQTLLDRTSNHAGATASQPSVSTSDHFADEEEEG